MREILEIEYLEIEKNASYEELINKVLNKCFTIEGLEESNLYVSITLTNPENIRKLNQKYRDVDAETDVLSFPMFEKEEITKIKKLEYKEALGDIVISIQRVEEQAKEYGHSFERELAYMVVHAFYHLIGEDHIEEKDKLQMRKKEENVLEKLNIIRS